MRLTTARYYTPSGRSIQAKGITPDILIEQAKIETIKSERVAESDLRGALDNKKPEKVITPVPESGPAEPAKDDKAAKKDEPKSLVDLVEDYQLARAIDLVRGVALYGGNFKTPANDVQETTPEAGAEKAPETPVVPEELKNSPAPQDIMPQNGTP
jgi:carboxyl-terminal processing protease